MKVRLWGTRGSIPTPLKPLEIRAKLRRALLEFPGDDPHDATAVDFYLEQLSPLKWGTAGGNTPCVEVQSGRDLLVLDAGTGLRELGLTLMRGAFGRGQGTLHLLISHPHWDHIQGFPMFVPAFIPGNRIFIYGFHDLRAALEMQQHALTWPVSLQYMSATIEFIPLKGETFQIGDIHVESLQNEHPGASYSYRLSDGEGTVVYATDVEYKQLDEAGVQRYIDFFRQADALIFDAQYTLQEAWKKEDWGHSSAMIGVDLARAAGVKQLLLFHHDPLCSDEDLERIRMDAESYQAQDPGRPGCEIVVAYEGMELLLEPERAIDWRWAPDGDTAILTSARVFDELSVELVARRLEEISGSPIIDLSEVETLTTGGLRALVTLQQQRPAHNLVLAVSSEQVRQVIRLTGYQNWFAVYPSVEAALEAVAARVATRLPGQVLGNRYQIEVFLEEGPLVTVLQVWDLSTQKRCLMRLLRPEFTAEPVDQLLNEAAAFLLLDHPHLVKVLAWEHCGDLIYSIEEFPLGQTLAAILADPDQALEMEVAQSLLLDLSLGLEYAHSRGVIHGDLRPENIYVSVAGIQIGGWGWCRLLEGRNLLESPVHFREPAYLAPEQLLGQLLDARTDLYALGVILYRILTGHLPFAGTAAALESQLSSVPVAPMKVNSGFSPSVDHLILKLLARNPNARYASVQQMRKILSSLLLQVDSETSPVSPQVLVAREGPLQILAEGWEKSARGEGQLFFITGEPGIGKSTLAQQAAALSGTSVLLTGIGEERGETAAYYFFSQMLRSYLETAPQELWNPQIRQLLANFMRLVPELMTILPDVMPAEPLEPEQEQLRLMGSLTQFVRWATQKRPWFFILDDLQWIDRGSLELLQYLGRHLPTMSLMIVGTYRDSDLSADHPLRETLRALHSEPGYRSISLERLDEAGVADLLANFWGQRAPAALVAKIYQHTAGNPFFVEEVAKTLVDAGQIVLKDGHWRFPTDLTLITLPASVRETVLHRVGLLPEETQTLLRQAAVLGQNFNYRDLQEMCGLMEWELLERLEPAMERQLVQETSWEGQLRFRHFEIHQVLYGDLSLLRRRLLHRQAGEALERLSKGMVGSRVDELAYHFELAGETAKAVVYGLQMARQAHHAYAVDAALLWYHRVLDWVLSGAEENLELELEIHQSLADAYMVVSRHEEALSQAVAAWKLLDQLPQAKKGDRSNGAYVMAQVYARLTDYPTALEWVERGLGYLDKEIPTPELARLLYLRGWMQTRGTLVEVARTSLEQALQVARQVGLQVVEADALRSLGVTCWQQQQMDQALMYTEQALQIYRELNDRYLECRTLNNLAIYYVTGDQYELGLESYQQALDIYQEIRDRAGEGTVLHNLGLLYWDYGDLELAQHYLEKALVLRQNTHDVWGEALTLDSLGENHMRWGDLESAENYLKLSQQITSQAGYLRQAGSVLVNLARVQAMRGEWSEAEATLIESERRARELNIRRDQLTALIYLIEANIHQQKLDRAEAIFVQAQGLADEQTHSWLRLRLKAEEAELRLAQGDLEAALAAIEPLLAILPREVYRHLDGPFVVYSICYQVLRAAGKSRAETVLQEAYECLQAWSHRLNPTKRQSFLEQVAVNRELIEWYQASRRGDNVES